LLFGTVHMGWTMNPQDRTPVLMGAALDVRPEARTIIMPLTVWAALPRST
jgi:hypothetical protein